MQAMNKASTDTKKWTNKGGALIYESYPSSDSRIKKINGETGVAYFFALWNYFIELYIKTHKTKKERSDIIYKLSKDTADIFESFNSSNMLKLDYVYLDYSITLQIINKINPDDDRCGVLIYYIIINLPNVGLHFTIHFNRNYKEQSARSERVGRRRETKMVATHEEKRETKMVPTHEKKRETKMAATHEEKRETKMVATHEEKKEYTKKFEFDDNKSILTPIHITSDTKYRSYYMTVSDISRLMRPFNKLMNKSDNKPVLKVITQCVFLGVFCSELVDLISSSFIINRIIIDIETYLNRVAVSGQKIDSLLLTVLKNKVNEEIEKVKDENVKLYEKLKQSNALLIIELYIKDVDEEYVRKNIGDKNIIIRDMIKYIKGVLFGIEYYKNMNTFLYDTNLNRGTDGTIRSSEELKDLSSFFKKYEDFEDYCKKYYSSGNIGNCDKYAFKARDIMGKVVEKTHEDNVIIYIGNIAVTSFIDAIDAIYAIDILQDDDKYTKYIIRLLELSDEIVAKMNLYISPDKYRDSSTLKNLNIMLTKWSEYKTKYSVHEPTPSSLTSEQSSTREPSSTREQSSQQPQYPIYIRYFQRLTSTYPTYIRLFQQDSNSNKDDKLHILNDMLITQRNIKAQLNEKFNTSDQHNKDMINDSKVLLEIDRDINDIIGEIDNLRQQYLQQPHSHQQYPQQQQYSPLIKSRRGGSKVVSNVINRYLDKIKEIRTVIKKLNDNKKKNKSKILTKRMQIKNIFTKIKIQREKEKEKRTKAKNTKKL